MRATAYGANGAEKRCKKLEAYRQEQGIKYGRLQSFWELDNTRLQNVLKKRLCLKLRC